MKTQQISLDSFSAMATLANWVETVRETWSKAETLLDEKPEEIDLQVMLANLSNLEIRQLKSGHHIFTGTRLAASHLPRDSAHPCHICTGTRLTAATSAPGLGFAGLMCVAPKLLSFYKTIPEPKTVPKGMSRVPEVRLRQAVRHATLQRATRHASPACRAATSRMAGVPAVSAVRSLPPPPCTNSWAGCRALSWPMLPTPGSQSRSWCDGCALTADAASSACQL